MKRMNLPTANGDSTSRTSSLLYGKQRGIRPPFGINLPAASNGDSTSRTSSLLRGQEQGIRPPFGLKDIDQGYRSETPIMPIQQNKHTNNVDQVNIAKTPIISSYPSKYSYDAKQVDTVKIPSIKQPKVTATDIICIAFLVCTFVLWCFSLEHEDVHKMNDLGMISTFPPSFIIALIIVTISFCLALGQSQLRIPLLTLHLVFVIFMLYGIQNIVEEATRFNVVYTHAGYTEYIMRTGSVNPNLDTYFDWPGFFVLSALVTQLAGYHDIFSYAGWAPVFYNLIYALPLYMILTVATNDKRLVWLGLWFFYLTNWIGQDYFSPQGLNFFFYLVIIAMLLKWFNMLHVGPPSQSRWLWRLGRFSVPACKVWIWVMAPDTHRIAAPSHKRTMLLIVMIVIFAFNISSHPLTPFFVIASVTVLVIFRRCGPWWLPLLMDIMTALWIIVMAQPFLVGHVDMVIGSIGQVNSSVTASVTSRVVQGNHEHELVAALRIIMSGLVWLLACGGALRRFRQGHRDITYILLAVVPFLIILVQQYGGEMFLRIYLFSLPFMVFFAAALFYPTYRLPMHGKLPWKTIIIICTNLVLLGGFLFTRYGNERVDYKTYDEVAGIRHLYAIAPRNSLFLMGWEGAPSRFKDYEKYQVNSMSNVLPNAVTPANANAVIQFLKRQDSPNSYLLFTRSEQAHATSYLGFSSNALDQLEAALLRSGKFKLLYNNRDAQILQFINAS